MGLMLDLSKLVPLLRRRPQFLFPESTDWYKRFVGVRKQSRKAALATVRRRARDALAEAKDLGEKAKRLAAARWDSEAEAELARRDSETLRKEAAAALKKAKAFRSAGRRMSWMPWKAPDGYDFDDPELPNFYWGIVDLAKQDTHNWETSKIASEGALVFASPGKSNSTSWLLERRLIQYRGRYFLLMLSKPNDPSNIDWTPLWVTDSTAQMTEEELRIIATGAPSNH